MTRFSGFFGKVRANLLLEQGLKFGVDCHSVNLRFTITAQVRRMLREHLAKPGVPQSKEEVFFALVVAVLSSLDPETLLQLYQDVEAYAGSCISIEVRSHFMAEIADLGPDQRQNINDYLQWAASKSGEAN